MHRLALAVLVLSASAAAQDATVVATFGRTTTWSEATQVLHALGLDPVPGSVLFEPVRLGVPLDAPPSPEALDALFASGALSVEVVRPAAQLVAAGFPADAIEAASLHPRYHVRVAFASDVSSEAAAARVTAAVGAKPTNVEKRANEARVRVPRPEVAGTLDRLGAAPGVLDVRVE